MCKVNFNSRSYKSQFQCKKCEIRFSANKNSRRIVVRCFDVILTEYSICVTILMIKGSVKVIASILRSGKQK